MVNNMKLAETFYIGCDDDGSVAEIGVHPTVRWDRFAVYSFNDIRCVLSLAFANTHILHQEKVLDKPQKYVMLLPLVNSKKKPQNRETYYEAITWIVENMIPPKHGIIISFYFYNPLYPQLMNMPTQDKTAIWPLKQQWIGDGDYITVHKFESITEEKRKNRSQDGQYELILDIENLSRYNVKYIDYTMPVSEMVELLQHTKQHYTYDGATWHLAGMMNVPTVVYGLQKFDTYNKGYWDPEQDIKHQIDLRETPFHIRTLQYDINKGIVYAGPQQFCFCTRNKKELKHKIKNV
jgi:hypothetical protein